MCRKESLCRSQPMRGTQALVSIMITNATYLPQLGR